METNTLPTMTQEELDNYLELMSDESELPIVKLDGFEDCMLYYTEENGSYHAVYCYEDLVESFARQNHSTFIEAVEFVDYNIMRGLPYMTSVNGKPAAEPRIIHRINRDFTTLDSSYFEKDYSDQ